MSKELQSWRTIVNTLIEYGLYDLLQDEIKDTVKVLKRGGIDD